MRQVQLTSTSAIIGIPEMAGTMQRVAQQCASVRRMILIGRGVREGFASMGDMLNDAGDLFNENIDVIKVL